MKKLLLTIFLSGGFLSFHPQLSAEKKIHTYIVPTKAILEDGQSIGNTAKLIEEVFRTDDFYIFHENTFSKRKINRIFKDPANPDTQLIARSVKPDWALKTIFSVILKENERYIARGWVFDHSKSRIEYTTSEEVSEKEKIEDALLMTGNRMSLFIKEKLDIISNLRVSDGTSDKEIILQWQSTKESEKYSIYRSDRADIKFIEIGSTASKTFNDTKSKRGIKYTYKIRGFSEGIFTDFSNMDTGYLKISKPKGLDIDKVLAKKNRTIPKYKTPKEKRIRFRDQQLLKRYIKHPVKLRLILIVISSYLKKGKLTLLGGFEHFNLDKKTKELSLLKEDYSYLIHFKSKRLTRLHREFGGRLFRRLIKNSMFFCVHSGEKEIVTEEGIIRLVPYYEAIGMSTEYFRDAKNWRERTLVFQSDKKKFKKQIKEAGG